MDGYPVPDKLTFMCHLVGHELVHTLLNTYGYEAFEDNTNHGPLFRTLSRNFFGHYDVGDGDGWKNNETRHRTLKKLWA